MSKKMKRSTESLYNEEYFKYNYKSWIDGGLNKDNPVIKRETEKKVSFIKRHMPGIKSVLVCGCAFGFLVLRLREEKYDARGIDVAQYPLNIAPEKVKPYLENMNVKSMIEFTDNKFELVTVFDVLEHLYIEEILQAIKEINRVASKFILIRVPVPYSNSEFWVSDFSNHPDCKTHKGHVSVYPWNFWAEQVEKLNKFKFQFTTLWERKPANCCEAWLVFKG